METPENFGVPPPGRPSFIRFGGKYYLDSDYQEALRETILKQVDQATANVKTPRQTLRALRDLKTEGQAQAVIQAALARLREKHTGVDARGLREQLGVVVADFSTLDKPTDKL